MGEERGAGTSGRRLEQEPQKDSLSWGGPRATAVANTGRRLAALTKHEREVREGRDGDNVVPVALPVGRDDGPDVVREDHHHPDEVAEVGGEAHGRQGGQGRQERNAHQERRHQGHVHYLKEEQGFSTGRLNRKREHVVEPLQGAHGTFFPPLHTHTHARTHTQAHTPSHVCVCVCVCLGGGGG